MDGKDFYNSAEKLYASADDEADFRSVASRAYYGAYHTAIDFCDFMGLALDSNKNSHSRVHDALLKNKRVSRLGKRLRNLKAMRVFADYNMSEGFPKTDANQQLKSACALILDIENKITVIEKERKESA